MQRSASHLYDAPTACRRMVSGTISLPCSGFFSPFLHSTRSLSVSREYLALPDGPGRLRRIPRVPRYSGYRYAAFRFTYWTITVYGHIFQSVLFTICIQCRGPTTPLTPCDVNGLGCSPFARHYWGNHSFIFSSSQVLRCFVPALALTLKCCMTCPSDG